jgi:hypothetical protein
MESEGMVHALELIWQVLRPDGILVDIHPSGEKPLIGVRRGASLLLAGALEETDDFVEYFQAEEALIEAETRAWFKLEQRDDFRFIVYADTPGEFQMFLDENYSDAVLKPDVYEKLEALVEGREDYWQVEMDELVRISRYARGGGVQTRAGK